MPSRMQQIIEEVQAMGDLPIMLEVLQSIQSISWDRKSSAVDLANAILKDTSLTSKVLKMVNSSYYGRFSGKVSTVTRAIVILGFKVIRELAAGLQVQNTFSHMAHPEHLKGIWTVSLASAIASKELSQSIHYANHEEAFVAALLQNIGQIILDIRFPDRYAQALEQAHDVGIIKAEQQMLRVNHARLGSRLARQWHFPQHLADAIRDHHRLDTPPHHKHHEPLVDLVYVGQLVANLVLEPAYVKIPKEEDVVSALRDLLDLATGDLQRITGALIPSLEELAEKLEIKLDIPSHPDQRQLEALEKVQRQLHGKEEEIAMLQDISASIAEGYETETILQLIVECLLRVSMADRVMMFILDEPRSRLQWAFALGNAGVENTRRIAIPLPKGSSLHKALQEGDMIAVQDAGQGPLPQSCTRSLRSSGYVLCPILFQKRLFGMLYMDRQQACLAIPEASRKTMFAMMHQASIALAMNPLQH